MKRVMGYGNALRLAFYTLGYGITGALIGGVLNRIMTEELALPVSLVGLFFALPMLVTPLRVWLGYRSDGFTLFGKRRESYVIVGALLTSLSVLVIAGFTYQFVPGASSVAVFALVGTLAFIFYGIGRNMAYNMFQALLTDKFTGVQRARAITVFEVTTLLGLTVGAGGMSRALADYSPARLLSVAVAIAIVGLVFAVIAVLRNEPRATVAENTRKARAVPFTQAVKQIAVGDPQVRLFFIIIMLAIVGTQTQDAFLEPYGARVFGLSVEVTTRLQMFWGIGAIVAMLFSGLVLNRFFSYLTIMRVGLTISALAFLGVIGVGVLERAALLQPMVLIMGLGTGVAGAGMVMGFTAFATPLRAGLLMGVWGTASIIGRAIGNLVGGVVIDTALVTTASPLTAYSLVFGLEVLFLGAALILSLRLHSDRATALQEVQPHPQAAYAAAGD